MFEFIETKTALLIIHIFGAILGAGGAFLSDGMFMLSVKDGRVNKTEMRFLALGSVFVSLGLLILVLSGVGLFLLDPSHYLVSDKFLAKMTVVGILIVNGILFHTLHIPLLRKFMGQKLDESRAFMKRSSRVILSGAVSLVSWTFAVILGMIKIIPYDYGVIMGVYLVVLACGVVAAFLMKKPVFRM